MKTTVTITPATVDTLAALSAQIKVLQEQADAIKASILECGSDEIIGTMHKVIVKHSIRTSLDSNKVKEAAPEIWEKFSKTIPVHQVCLLAR